MYLFDKCGNKIETYALNPNAERICEFKKAEAENSSLENNFYIAETNSDRCLENAKEYIDYSKINYEEADFFEELPYHKLLQCDLSTEEKAKKLLLLEDYYKTHTISSNKILKIKNSIDDINYLLLLAPYYYRKRWSERISMMNNIVNIPKSLYSLEAFIRGQLHNVSDEDLKKIIELYDFCSYPVATFNFDDMNLLDQVGLSKGIINSTSKKLEESKRVLKLIKK